ncbi:MAG: sugar phosphate isomerase/epimerase [Clostridia bacterium]|nr:sugar phosphate isomerase/epimerase [Clostridia bacterium]
MSEFIISAFADEAGASLAEQLDALKANKLGAIEPRGLDKGNIADYGAEDVKEVKKRLDDAGIVVSAIGSPFGKINIADDFGPHFEKFKQTVENACILETPNIRMFSFYFDKGQSYEDLRGEVIDRVGAMAEYSLGYGVRCCHENEKGIYGDTDDRCLDILEALGGKLWGVFDPANFIQCGVDILPAFEKLKDYVEYMHVKDCRYRDGFVVPAGKGDGHLRELLARFAAHCDSPDPADDALPKRGGRTRFLTLEPHLKVFAGLSELEQTGGAESVSEAEFTYPTNRAAFDAACAAFFSIHNA